MQPQIRLADRISAHLLTNLLVLAVLVLDTAICDRMDDVYALFAELSRQRLRQLPHRSATSAVRGKLRAASECTQCAGENERLSC